MKNLITTVVILIICASSIQAQNQTAKKYLNVELLSNTWCGLCAFYDPPAIDIYQANKKNIHLTSIHPDVPYDECEFNQANIPHNNARKNYYSVTSTPKTFTHGTILNTGPNLLTQSFIDAQTGQTSPFRIEVIETGASTNKSVYVYVKSFETPPVGDIRLFVAAVVEKVDFNAQNGLTEHHNVLWKYLGSENGDSFVPATINNTTSFLYSYNTANLTHPNFDANQVYVIAFLQDYNTKTVYNSGSSKDIIVDADIGNATCGSNNGAINLSIRGGAWPYSVNWSNGMQTQNINGLPQGSYNAIITDAANAEVETTITVNCSTSCSTLRNFSGSHQSDAIFEAGETINSTATVNANITYSAGQRIHLNSGFSSKNPHHFSAYIGGCN